MKKRKMSLFPALLSLDLLLSLLHFDLVSTYPFPWYAVV